MTKTADAKIIYDEESKTHRPQHKGRIRAFGGAARLSKKPPDGHAVEVWEGGKFTGWIRVRKSKPRGIR